MATPIPNLTGGAATSGPATSTGTFGPVNIGGLFGSGAASASNSPNLVTIAVIGAVVLLGLVLMRRR